MQVKTRNKQTEIGMIPEDWAVRPLLKAVQLPTGQVDPRKAPYSSMILVAPDHVESCTGRLLARVSAAEQGAISGKFLFSQGNIIYSKIRPYLKKAVIADFEGLCSADMYPMAPVDGMCAGYLLAVLLGHRFSSFAESVSVRSGIPKINRTELSEYLIAVPPLPEQRAIAAALSDVDTLINSLDRLIAKKRDIKQATMQQLLTGKTRLPGFKKKDGYKQTEIGLIPEDWCVNSLGELGSFKNGINKSQEDFGFGFPFVNLMDVFGKLRVMSESELDLVNTSSAERKTYELKQNDVLIVRSSVKPEGVGLTTRVCENLIDTVFSGFLIRFRASDYLAGEFLEYCFSSCDFRSRLLANSTVSANTNINQNALRTLVLAFPSDKTEQCAIATVISEMENEIVALERRRDKTLLLKQGMMQELLTGRTRLI